MTATINHPPSVRRHTFLQLPDFIPEGMVPPCRDVDPELFFPLPTQSGDEAIAICRHCPVEVECGQWAIEARIQDGIWGGLTPTQRENRRRLEVLAR